MPILKLNLKFDIEISFKNLGVNIKSVKPTSLLKDRNKEIDGNPDFRRNDYGVAQGSQPQMTDELKFENICPHNPVELLSQVCLFWHDLSKLHNNLLVNHVTVMEVVSLRRSDTRYDTSAMRQKPLSR